MPEAIEIKGLTKKYNNFQLGPLDLVIPTGCLVGYIGENGAGKTTTLKAILGLIKPDSGEIKLLGQTLPLKDPKLMNRVGVVFDDLHLPGEMSVKEAGKYASLSFDSWQEELFQEFLHNFKLPSKQKLKNLSRGMKVKLSLALALSHEAELLILDEATSGLDPVIRDEILDLLLAFLQEENHSVLISSHILSDLEKAADYIAFLHQGKILFMEEKDQLVERYALCSVDNATAEALDPAAIVGRRKHAFGQDQLPDFIDCFCSLERLRRTQAYVDNPASGFCFFTHFPQLCELYGRRAGRLP